MIEYSLTNFKTKNKELFYLENNYGIDLIKCLEKINNISKKFYFINIFYRGELKTIKDNDKLDNNKEIIYLINKKKINLTILSNQNKEKKIFEKIQLDTKIEDIKLLIRYTFNLENDIGLVNNVEYEDKNYLGDYTCIDVNLNLVIKSKKGKLREIILEEGEKGYYDVYSVNIDDIKFIGENYTFIDGGVEIDFELEEDVNLKLVQLFRKGYFNEYYELIGYGKLIDDYNTYEGYFKNDLLEGEGKILNNNKDIIAEGMFKDGFLFKGKADKYSIRYIEDNLYDIDDTNDTILSFTGTFENGYLTEGKIHHYYEDENNEIIFYYLEVGKFILNKLDSDGYTFFTDEEGKIVNIHKEGKFKNGKLIKGRIFDYIDDEYNEEIIYEGNFKNELLDGEGRIYSNKTGDVISKGIFKDGILQT